MASRMTAIDVERAYDDLYRSLVQLRNNNSNNNNNTSTSAATRRASVAAYKTLHARFAALTCDSGSNGDHSNDQVAAAVADAEAAAAAAEDELRQLEQQQQPAASACTQGSDHATRRATHVHAATTTATTAVSVRSPFVAFATQLADVHAQLVLAQQVCRALLNADATALRDERVSAADVRLVSASSWRTREQQLVKAMAQLRRKAAALQQQQQQSSSSSSSQLLSRSVAEVQELLTSVQDAATAADEQLRRAAVARRVRDAQLTTFADECRRLTTWCLQQQANLDAMHEPDHVQEFCATLVSNYAVMSQNFTYLRTSVDAFLRGGYDNNNDDHSSNSNSNSNSDDNGDRHYAAVRTALRDAHERYVHLQVATLERIAHTLYELHPHSPLEAEAERYADYTTRLAAFARAMTDYVRTRPAATSVARNNDNNNDDKDDDDDVDTVALRARQTHALLRAAEEVTTLLRSPPPAAQHNNSNNNNSGGCAQLPREVRAFAARARALRRAYGNFRDATLCRATYLAASDDMDARALARQVEFDAAVRELKAWAHATAQGESWRDVYGKLVELKRTIQREQQACGQDTTAAAAS